MSKDSSAPRPLRHVISDWFDAIEKAKTEFKESENKVIGIIETSDFTIPYEQISGTKPAQKDYSLVKIFSFLSDTSGLLGDIRNLCLELIHRTEKESYSYPFYLVPDYLDEADELLVKAKAVDKFLHGVRDLRRREKQPVTWIRVRNAQASEDLRKFILDCSSWITGLSRHFERQDLRVAVEMGKVELTSDILRSEQFLRRRPRMPPTEQDFSADESKGD